MSNFPVAMANTSRVSIHIVASVADEASGPSYSVPRLSAALCDLGMRSEVFATGVRGATTSHGASVQEFPVTGHRIPLLKRFNASQGLYREIRRRAERGDILHSHGLWLLPNIYPAWVRKRVPLCRLIHAPRGMLGREALHISSTKKIVTWRTFQRRALEAADCLHATARSEYDEIRAIGLNNPVAIIPNGIDLPDLTRFARSDERHRTVLALGRIHPKKALDDLVRAWSAIESEAPNWRLRIVGPAEVGHDKQLNALAASLGAKRISIEGPVYGNAKLALYRASDLFVLPTHNENFAMTVAEALSAGTPVICSKGAPWSGLSANGCGWWIDRGVEPLSTALKYSTQLPRAELQRMGDLGRLWMAKEFSWHAISLDMADVYAWVSGRTDQPKTVITV